MEKLILSSAEDIVHILIVGVEGGAEELLQEKLKSCHYLPSPIALLLLQTLSHDGQDDYQLPRIHILPT